MSDRPMTDTPKALDIDTPADAEQAIAALKDGPRKWRLRRQDVVDLFEIIRRALVERDAARAEADRLREAERHAQNGMALWHNEAMTLRALAAELVEGLGEARDDVESWAAYASDYFTTKHDLAGDLARIDALIAKARAVFTAPKGEKGEG